MKTSWSFHNYCISQRTHKICKALRAFSSDEVMLPDPPPPPPLIITEHVGHHTSSEKTAEQEAKRTRGKWGTFLELKTRRGWADTRGGVDEERRRRGHEAMKGGGGEEETSGAEERSSTALSGRQVIVGELRAKLGPTASHWLVWSVLTPLQHLHITVTYSALTQLWKLDSRQCSSAILNPSLKKV